MLNTFIEAIDNEVENLLNKKTALLKLNLSIQEKEALKELANRDHLIFSKADKVGATVIQDIDSYITEVTWQLEDSNFYNKW